MFGFAVELVLILVTLLAAIAGTVSKQSRALKGGIIGLAVLTSVGTIFTVWDSQQEAERNARSITALVQAVDPPEYFAHDLVRAMGPLLEGSGQFVSGQNIMPDRGERLLFLAENDGSDELAGVLFFSRRQMEPIYYAYAVEEDLVVPLRAHLATRWTDCTVHWNACLLELGGIAREAMDLAPLPVEQTSAGMSEDMAFSLVSDVVWDEQPLTITLDGVFVQSLYGLDPAERGLRILEAAQASLIGQL